MKTLRKATNEILANTVYLDKEKEKQIKKLKSSMATKEDIEQIVKGWDCRKMIAEQNRKLLNDIIKEYENNGRS